MKITDITKEKKSKTISIRCTEKEYNTLTKAADKNSEDLSEYILNQSIAGRAERNRLRKKDQTTAGAIVFLQQAVNELDSALIFSQCYTQGGSNMIPVDVPSRMKIVKEGIHNLWALQRF